MYTEEMNTHLANKLMQTIISKALTSDQAIDLVTNCKTVAEMEGDLRRTTFYGNLLKEKSIIDAIKAYAI